MKSKNTVIKKVKSFSDFLCCELSNVMMQYPETFSDKIYDAVTIYEGIEEVKQVGIRKGLELAISIIKAESRNGIPFPKGHGRLSDMDELVKNIVKEYGVNSTHELPQDIKMFYDKFINSAPTILDATFDYKLKNYAFFDKESEE